MITFEQFCSIADGKDPSELFTRQETVSYLPMDRKMSVISIAAQGMIDDDGKQTMPPVCIKYDDTGYATVDTAEKYIFLANVYLTLYFNVDFESGEFTIDDYDYFAQKGLQGKINRLADKNSACAPIIKHLVIEQQNDFKLFEKMLNKELADACAIANDPYKRMQAYPQMIVNAILDRIELDLTPEKLQKATDEIKGVVAEIEGRQKQLKISKDR